MDFDTQIARVKDLIAKREEIDAELAGILGSTPKAEHRFWVWQVASHFVEPRVARPQRPPSP
jgi:hypothetical protein